jgi:ABC-type phosphate/phosphonate transport system substrate-binding protein
MEEKIRQYIVKLRQKENEAYIAARVGHGREMEEGQYLAYEEVADALEEMLAKK